MVIHDESDETSSHEHDMDTWAMLMVHGSWGGSDPLRVLAGQQPKTPPPIHLRGGSSTVRFC